jgi:hypothetical protein
MVGPLLVPLSPLLMNRRSWPRTTRPVANRTEKDPIRQLRKRSLTTILLGVLPAFILAGALTFAAVNLLRSKGAGAQEGTAPPQKTVSANSTASPVMVGTDHPVPVNPTPTLSISAGDRSSNPVTAPVPQAPAVAEHDSGREQESQSEAAREKTEQAREAAEQKRVRVEDLYQRHLISEEAYKKGLAEYEQEMAKYKDQIEKYRSTATGTTNE